MLPDENKAVVRRFFEEACNNRDTVVIKKVFSHDVEFNGTPGSPEDVYQFVKELQASFENLHVEVNRQVAEGNWVSTLRTWTGVQKAQYKGQPPTGEPMSWKELSIVRLEGGKIKEDWVIRESPARIRLSDEQKSFLLKDYELKVRYLSDHFQRMWTRFNFFLTVE